MRSIISDNNKTSLPESNPAFGELKKTPAQKAARRILVACIWIALWYLAWAVVQQEILIASPGEVVLRLGQLALTGDFWVATLSSLARIVIGFLLAAAIGCVLAVLCHLSSFLYDLFYPVIRIIRATPVASFIILALIWLNTNSVPVFASFLMVFPIVWENVYRGIKGTDRDLLDMVRVFRLKKSSVIKNVFVPSVMPYFIAACNIGIGMAWKAGIAAEILGVPLHSIGTELYRAKIYLETVDVFAWTVVVIALSVLIEKLFLGLLKKAGEKYNLKDQEG
jgi:NitT/TauT family transport system permease protein